MDKDVFDVFSSEGKVKSFSFASQAIEFARNNGFIVKMNGDLVFPRECFVAKDVARISNILLGSLNDFTIRGESINSYDKLISDSLLVSKQLIEFSKNVKTIKESYCFRNELILNERIQPPVESP